jgi:hypothetical protein
LQNLILANRFHHDGLSQVGADGQTGIADEADNIRTGGDQFNHLLLAKADFPEAQRHVVRGAKLFNPHRHPCAYLAQGAGRRRGTSGVFQESRIRFGRRPHIHEQTVALGWFLNYTSIVQDTPSFARLTAFHLALSAVNLKSGRHAICDL